MIEKPLTSEDVEFVTTLHGREAVSFVVLMQPRGDQDVLLRAIDDVALGELKEAVREGEEPEGVAAKAPSPPCEPRAPRPWAGSSRTIRWTCSSPWWTRWAPTR